jgi:uroporphyrinogen decarboxylase
MSKKEFLDKVFAGESLPRVPVGFWFHFLEEAETGDALKDPRLFGQNIEGHRAFIEKFDPDLVKVMSDGFFGYPADGDLDSLGGLETAIQDVGPSHPWIARQVELLGKVMEIDPKNNFFYNIFSPMTTLRFLIGFQRTYAFLKESPERVSGVLSRIGVGLASLATAVVRDAGGSGIYLSVQNPDLGSFSDAFYASHVTPSDLQVLGAAIAAGGRNILHVCGYAGVRNNVGFFSSYGADAFNWAVNVEGVPLSAGRALFPGKVLIGGFPNTKGSVIHAGTHDEISAWTKKIIQDAGPKALIVGADCTVPGDTSLKRLSWVRDAARL